MSPIAHSIVNHQSHSVPHSILNELLNWLIQKEEKSLMKYRVNLKKTEEGYSVWVPGLPGCWSQGKSEAEALENVKDAIGAYLETVDKLTADKETRYVEIAYA